MQIMAKRRHEVRDAVHVFVDFDDDERKVVDCPAFQRLRAIHQLAMTYEVYPGATHRRFEHSLGVMHLAGRVYDVVAENSYKISDDVREVVPDPAQGEHGYWRAVVRMAALCHDLGHLPFSHAAENLLPQGASHELMTWRIVHSDPIAELMDSMTPPLRPDVVAKIAIGPDKVEKLEKLISPDHKVAFFATRGDSLRGDRW